MQLIKEGEKMDVNIDYGSIDGYAAIMNQIADELYQIYQGINYYHYGSIQSEGNYAKAFETMRQTILELLLSMRSFMISYSVIVSKVARNLDILDTEICELITTSGFNSMGEQE
jgi:hypothetical protein